MLIHRLNKVRIKMQHAALLLPWLLLFLVMLEIWFLDVIISLMVLYKALLKVFYRKLTKSHVMVEENRKIC